MERSLPEVYQKISKLILQILSQKINPRDISGGFFILRNYMTVYIDKKFNLVINLPYEIKEEYKILNSLINDLSFDENFIKIISDFINNYFNSSNYIKFYIRINYD